jgi:hypothetical protein
MKKKTLEMINDETADLIDVFSLKGKVRLIGSQSLRAIQYGSDYDIQTDLKNTTAEQVAKRLQKAYAEAKKNPDYWITDFKAGWDDRLIYRGDYSKDSIDEYLEKHKDLIPKSRANKIRKATGEEEIKLVRDLFILRWKPADIKRGWVKMIDGKKKWLKDALLDKTTLKIDLLGKVGNQFVEVSENYEIQTRDGKNNMVRQSSKEIEEDFEDEITYYARKDSFKALKRLFSLLQHDGKEKHKKALDQLVDFFNSQVGYLNKIRNELKILEQILTQDFRKVEWKDVEENLQFIKEQISNIYQIPLNSSVFSDIDDMTEKDALVRVADLIEYFTKVINEHSKSFLEKML